MRQITLRGVSEDIEAIAQEEARSKGISLNKAFLSLLRKGAESQRSPHRKKGTVSGEFHRFAGLWEENEADAFDASLDKEREIDRDLWS